MRAAEQHRTVTPAVTAHPRRLRAARWPGVLGFALVLPMLTLSATAQTGTARTEAQAVATPDEVAALRDRVASLSGRLDELSLQLQRQERLLGALSARLSSDAPPAVPPSPPPAPGARPAPQPAGAPPAVPGPAARPDSNLPALIVMVGPEGALTLAGRPVALPTLGFALRAAANGDPSRRVVVGSEPEAGAERVGAVVAAVAQAGFGRITITGP